MTKPSPPRADHGDSKQRDAPVHHRHGEVVVDRAGRCVEVSGLVWVTNDPTQSCWIDWRKAHISSAPIYAATQDYMKHLIRSYSVGEIKNNWGALYRVWRSRAFQTECRSGGNISYKTLSEVRTLFSSHEAYRFHFVRKWYIWCCSQGYECFCPEVALQLGELVIGGNAKGEAVLSAAPDEGPFSESEIVTLTNALRTASGLTLKEQVAIWLCIALGANSGPLCLLREEDFEEISIDGSSGPIYQLRVPRQKKGDPIERRQFRTRKVNAHIADLIKALISENRATAPVNFYKSNGAALLRRDKPRRGVGDNDPLSEYRYHFGSSDFLSLVSNAVKKLAIISPRTDDYLNVSVRRFRYTYATRMVREGASAYVVADALDHTDLQNVRIYFDIKSDIVRKLDRTMALELAPLSQAFLGKLVRRESDAIRGNRPTSKVYHAVKDNNALDALGTCGSFSFCGLAAPIACYTCTKFQPWMDAPHDKALQGLLEKRQQRIDEGQDGQMVTLLDNTIFAIAAVIIEIETRRRSEECGGE